MPLLLVPLAVQYNPPQEKDDTIFWESCRVIQISERNLLDGFIWLTHFYTNRVGSLTFSLKTDEQLLTLDYQGLCKIACCVVNIYQAYILLQL